MCTEQTNVWITCIYKWLILIGPNNCLNVLSPYCGLFHIDSWQFLGYFHDAQRRIQITEYVFVFYFYTSLLELNFFLFLS